MRSLVKINCTDILEKMSASFENAFEQVKILAHDFKTNEKYFLSQQYQEAEARRDFIDKFLIALGWDV
ncbi:MAG: hypothetical protein K8R21_15735, partial [Leptospira sp.]|nr:hypothetical protein [Leptospira sp.]